MEGAGIGTVGGAAIGALAEHLQRNGANRHHFAPEAPPRHSILYHSNPPAPLLTAFARPIRTRETRNGAVITTSRPAMETGSTLIRAVPDHTRSETATDPRSRGIEFKYLGHGPGKQKGCEPESSRP